MRCASCMKEIEAAVCPHCGYPERSANQPPQLPVGTVLRQRYQLGKVLNQEDAAITYLSWDNELQRRVCIREFFPWRSAERSGDGQVCSRMPGDARYRLARGCFQQEVLRWTACGNIPRIEKYLDIFEENGTFYAVMEHIQGMTLRDFVQRRGGRLTVEEAFRLLRPVMQAMAGVHARGLLHRDISPTTILLDPMEGAKLVDFDILKTVRDSLGRDPEAVAIRNRFEAVETAVENEGKMGPWSDVYAMCATLYYCLTGNQPEAAMSRAANDSRLDWSGVPGLEPHQRQALEKGFALRPEDRFANMGGLLAAMFPVNEPAPVVPQQMPVTTPAAAQEAPAAPRKEPEIIKKPRKASGKRIALVIAGLLVLLAVLAVIFVPKLPPVRYDKAMGLVADGQYVKAQEIFEALGDYKDSEEQVLRCRYHLASRLMEEEEYEAAAKAFEELDDFLDSDQMAQLCRNILDYHRAETLMAQEQYTEAAEIFEALGDYRDSAEKAVFCEAMPAYNQAKAHMENGEYIQAIALLQSLGSHLDSRELLQSCVQKLSPSTVSAGGTFTVALRADGTVVATGDNDHGQCDLSHWTDIVAVEAGSYHVVGLKADGTVVSAGKNDKGQCNVSGWTDIVSVSAGAGHTVGLKSDGTVVAVGDNGEGQCNVSGWQNIVAVSAGEFHTLGLCADGTVVATGLNDYNQCNVSGWEDIVAISAGYDHSVGLRSNGTVVAVGNNKDGACNVSGWSNIVAISGGGCHTVALRADGTAVAVGWNDSGRCNVSSWQGIVAISAGGGNSLGLKPDGTVVVVGWNPDGRGNVTGWKNIRVPD